VLIVESATRPDERAALTQLSDLARSVASLAPRGPALLIVGDIAAKADQALVLARSAQGIAA
jgi:uroporphyrin-III C-methyltransferase/precorrin-2 dehydrogenase/sirohydrochlorin ferrochelatase